MVVWCLARPPPCSHSIRPHGKTLHPAGGRIQKERDKGGWWGLTHTGLSHFIVWGTTCRKAFRWEHLQSLICGETVRDNMALELFCDSETGKLCTLWEQLQVQQVPSGPEERRSSQPQIIIRLHLSPVSNLYHFMAQNCPFFFPL